MKIHLTSTSSIPLSLYRKESKGLKPYKPYEALFKKLQPGSTKPVWRLYLKPSGVVVKDFTAPAPILEFLQGKGMVIDDHTLGTCFMPDGKRTTKIGKVLSKEPALKKIFDNDPKRAASKGASYLIVISRHPYDILGSSFDRGWTSCMNLEEGANKHYLKKEIESGTLVAYFVQDTKEGRNINNPTARIMLRPYIGDKNKDRILVPGPVYGTAPDSFSRSVKEWSSNLNQATTGYYTLVKGLYAEVDHAVGGNNTKILYTGINSEITLPELEKFSKSSNTTPVRIQIAGIESKDLLREVYLSKKIKCDVKYPLAANPNTPVEILEEIFEYFNKDKISAGLTVILYNPSTPLPIILSVIEESSDYDVLFSAISSPKLTPEFLEDLGDTVNKYIVIAAMLGAKKLSEKNQLRILSKDGKILFLAATHTDSPKVIEAVLKKLAKNPSSSNLELEAIIENKATSPESLLYLYNTFLKLKPKKLSTMRKLVSNHAAPSKLLDSLAEELSKKSGIPSDFKEDFLNNPNLSKAALAMVEKLT